MLAVPATEQHLMAAVEAVERMHSRYKQAIFSWSIAAQRRPSNLTGGPSLFSFFSPFLSPFLASVRSADTVVDSASI